MADREPDDLLGALPKTRPQRRARRERAAGSGGARAANRPKAAPGSGAASRADAGKAEPVGASAGSTGLAPDAARSQHKAAPASAKPPAKARTKGPGAAGARTAADGAKPSLAATRTAARRAKPAASAAGTGAAAPGSRATAAKSGAPKSGAPKGKPGAERRRHVRAVPDPTPAVPPAGWSAPAPERTRTDVVGAAVQAVGELAQLGVAVSGATLRGVLRRIPRP